MTGYLPQLTGGLYRLKPWYAARLGPARRVLVRRNVPPWVVTLTALLAAGRDVIIYPEGTRSRDGVIGEFRGGAARLAAAAGAPLVPVGVTGTRVLLAPGGRLRRARVTVRIGAPLRPGGALPPLSSGDPAALMTRARSEVSCLTGVLPDRA